ncbi:hypothetical protein [Tardiphaga sp.]|uniref:hypothetical protein n=1 Tax=Tardiphaga sp. TaxID=1926292 RepID=UPI0026222A7C|nr:hypothetical protein [Tardiphaga sp.]MDB5619963.1 hypothetical protein [Tardiphaga sp.]
MLLLLIAGIGVILAGLVAIGFGIPVKEFGFGNTLILTGTIGGCTGLIMISLAVVIREIRNFVPAAGKSEPAVNSPLPRRELPPAPGDSAPDHASDAPAGRALFSRDQPAAERAGAAPLWQDEASGDGRREDAEQPPAVQPPPEEPKRRNLLFSSTRREREREEAERAAAEAGAAPSEAAAPPRPSFADAWPATERTRPELPRRPARPPSPLKDAAPEEKLIPERYVPPLPPAPPEAPAAEVTVLKSGVVDGMAYSLYSDGSIEAQMPEGMMRFASIDELREHLDQRT